MLLLQTLEGTDVEFVFGEWAQRSQVVRGRQDLVLKIEIGSWTVVVTWILLALPRQQSSLVPKNTLICISSPLFILMKYLLGILRLQINLSLSSWHRPSIIDLVGTSSRRLILWSVRFRYLHWFLAVDVMFIGVAGIVSHLPRQFPLLDT